MRQEHCPVCWAKTDSYVLCVTCAEKRRKAMAKNCSQGGGREEHPTPKRAAKTLIARNEEAERMRLE